MATFTWTGGELLFTLDAFYSLLVAADFSDSPGPQSVKVVWPGSGGGYTITADPGSTGPIAPLSSSREIKIRPLHDTVAYETMVPAPLEDVHVTESPEYDIYYKRFHDGDDTVDVVIVIQNEGGTDPPRSLKLIKKIALEALEAAKAGSSYGSISERVDKAHERLSESI